MDNQARFTIWSSILDNGPTKHRLESCGARGKDNFYSYNLFEAIYMSRNIWIGIVVALVLVAGGWWYLNQSSVPAISETTQLPTTQNTNNTGTQSVVNNQPSTNQPAPINNSPQNNVRKVSQPQVQPFFVKPGEGPPSLQSSIHPEKEDWLIISANGPDMSVDLTGWTVRSTQSGKSSCSVAHKKLLLVAEIQPFSFIPLVRPQKVINQSISKCTFRRHI